MREEKTLKHFALGTINAKNFTFDANYPCCHCNFHLSHSNSHLRLASAIRFNVTWGFIVSEVHYRKKSLMSPAIGRTLEENHHQQENETILMYDSIRKRNGGAFSFALTGCQYYIRITAKNYDIWPWYRHCRKRKKPHKDRKWDE